jgi:hypothetical protein
VVVPHQTLLISTVIRSRTLAGGRINAIAAGGSGSRRSQIKLGLFSRMVRNRWKAKTVRKWQRLGYDDQDIVVHLVDAIPGEAVFCLEKRGLAEASLTETMKHLDRLYGIKITTNSVMAEAQLDKTVRGPRELAHRYSRIVEVLATAAALPGEDIDMKAMRSFVKGYNCSITESKLWGALKCSDCTLTRLVGIAEKCEVRYKLKQDDPVADRQPKIYVSNGNDRAQKTPWFTVEIVV